MCAWGFGLFQSEHDYDLIGELNKEAAVYDIEAQDARAIVAQGKQVKITSEVDREKALVAKIHEFRYNQAAVENAKAMRKGGIIFGELETVPCYYNMYARMCANVQRVREHLDSGILAMMFAKRQGRLRTEYSSGYDWDGYEFILLGACGMSSGCRLSGSTIALMRKHYKNVGLMRDAKVQLEKALDENTRYVNGTAWDFGSLGLVETIESGQLPAKEDRHEVDFINVMEPGVPKQRTPDTLLEAMRMLNDTEENKHGMDGCGACGAKKAKDRKDMLTCNKCQKRKYCSFRCAVAHRELHLLICHIYARMGQARKDSKVTES